MAFECRVECDSIGEPGRCTSFVITAPRVVLAELVTHRVNKDSWGEMFWRERSTDESISKNSASSRAIPFDKMLEKIKDDPYMPMWTLNQKGMQGAFASEKETIEFANRWWLALRDQCIDGAEQLHSAGIHKQDVNRVLEPWAWVTQIITSTRWDNFFALRCHEAAHPAFRRIARMMFLARRKSQPKILGPWEWHLPFFKDYILHWKPAHIHTTTYENIPIEIKFSAARCAWVSYENHDRDGSPEMMLNTWERLFAEIPVHASPVEHQATPLGNNILHKWRSNLTGWLQARKLLPHEEIKNYNPSQEVIKSWNLSEYE